MKLKNTSVTDTISQGELQLNQVQKNYLLNIHLGRKECSDSYTEWFPSNDSMMAKVVSLLKYWIYKGNKSVCIEEYSPNEKTAMRKLAFEESHETPLCFSPVVVSSSLLDSVIS